MGLDLRWPIGLMFSLLGILLTITGLINFSNTEMHRRSLGINVDLWWGLVLLAFGVFMLLMTRKGEKTLDPNTKTDAKTDPGNPPGDKGTPSNR